MARLVKKAGTKTKTTALKVKNKVMGKEIGKGDLVRLNKYQNRILAEGWRGRVRSVEPGGYLYVMGVDQKYEKAQGVRNNVYFLRAALFDLVKKQKL